MDNSFFDALSLLGSENNVDIAQLVEKVKSAAAFFGMIMFIVT